MHIGPSLSVCGGQCPAALSSLLTGILAYWKLDEASGTRADSTANALNLTDNNTVTQAAGKVGSAAQFTRANSEYLSRADENLLDLTTALSVAGWVYLDTLDRQSVIAKSEVNPNAGWQSEYELGTWRFTAYTAADASAAGIGEVATGPSTATWYHLAWVYDGTQTGNANRLKFYINGAAQTLAFAGTIPATLLTNAAPFRLGNYAGGNFFNGRLDEWGLWSAALTAAQVGNLYNGGSGVTYPFTGVP